jgi:hypothetical protein
VERPHVTLSLLGGYLTKHLLSVPAMQHAEQPSVCSSDQDPLYAPLPQVFSDFSEWHMGADGARPCLHDLRGGRFGGSVEHASAEITQDDAGIVQHRTAVLVDCLQAVPHVAQAVVEATDWNIPTHAVFYAEDVCLLPFYWQTARQPIHLTGDIVKDPHKTKTFEPPRRSWA